MIYCAREVMIQSSGSSGLLNINTFRKLEARLFIENESLGFKKNREDLIRNFKTEELQSEQQQSIQIFENPGHPV